ncbi:MAG: MBOAT family protein [Oscillospiraceae bacterium]|nr:MBOAT family protein [Oscillospiraceae bacterium]
MVFSSLIFVYLFFPLCMLLYFLPVHRLRRRGKQEPPRTVQEMEERHAQQKKDAPQVSIPWRNGVLIAFSLLFYAWGEPAYVLLMLLTAFIDYFLALRIEKATKQRVKRALMAVAAISNLGFLVFFKYTGFLAETVNLIPGVKLPVPHILMPIGISFYTFQILSYVIDVYRGDVKAQRSFPKVLLFLTLFHQLVAGPIVRYDHVAKEIEHRTTGPKQIWAGIGRFAAGLAKKALLANTCGALADQLLDPAQFASLPVLGAWMGLLLFAMQIYFDFSAYSDMAIGMGQMVGLHYHENFDYPYVSKSITEFWRRWHMSLGTFFRDYVYIPLGGNRKHQFRNILVVWALTGLWHGASWNFVLWGLYYFLFLIFEKYVLKRMKRKPPAAVMHLYTLLVVVLGWVFFYYTNIADAFALFGKLFGGATATTPEVTLALQNNMFFLALALVACLPVTRLLKQWAERVSARSKAAGRAVLALQYALVLALLLLSTIQLAGNSFNPFIYYRF